MVRRFYVFFFSLGILAVTLTTAQPILAALGESIDSVMSDRKAMSAMKGATTVRSGYTIEEVVSDSTTVREYISPSGVIFGIAWNGLVHPDLRVLLGSYAGEYSDALRQRPLKPGRRPYQQIKTKRVVVEKWGHMRNLRGRAYAPALVPSGASVDEIK